jgi:hypothetical protein
MGNAAEPTEIECYMRNVYKIRTLDWGFDSLPGVWQYSEISVEMENCLNRFKLW